MTLSYRLDGPEDAPTLVLSPSLGTTTSLWEPQLPALTRSFRVLRHDLPGHTPVTVPGPGLAPGARPQGHDPQLTVADIGEGILALLDELGVERASFCGISLGGMVGMWLGAAAPQRIDRLVLACTGASLGTPQAYFERAALVREEGIEPVLEGARERWFTPAFRDTPAARRVLDTLREIPRDGYAACCEAVGGFDFHDRLHLVAPPTLVVHGSDDVVTPPAVVEALLSGIQDAVDATIDGAAHLANVEQPEAFTRALLDHLEERAP